MKVAEPGLFVKASSRPDVAALISTSRDDTGAITDSDISFGEIKNGDGTEAGLTLKCSLTILWILIAALANLCFQWGVPMKRWEKAVQPQIPKDKGTPHITRILRITILEADLNICLS
jgi:hypothetical protein